MKIFTASVKGLFAFLIVSVRVPNFPKPYVNLLFFESFLFHSAQKFEPSTLSNANTCSPM